MSSAAKYLLSIEQLSASWGKSYDAIKKMIQRGTLCSVARLSQSDAGRLGLEWGDGRGGLRNKLRPYVDINDQAIPAFVRQRILEAILQNGRLLTKERPTPLLSPLVGDLAPTTDPALGKPGPALLIDPPLSDQLPAPLADGAGTDVVVCPQRGQGTDPSRHTIYTEPLPDAELESLIYARAPEWSRRQADKYLALVTETSDLKGEGLRLYIDKWNKDSPELATSYRSVKRMQKRFVERGLEGLLADYGKSAGRTKIPSEVFEHFKSLYLKEGAPSVMSCWIQTIGRFYKECTDKASIPSQGTFLYQLTRQLPEDAIYLARYGRENWNKKYNSYIMRDYSNVLPGECWVSDHAQIDVAVRVGDKYVFPWVTAFCDFKSGKWLGWMLHAEAPNSDHIFQAFYWSALEYGLPKYVYIDNGKDYRCKDFAGNRSTHRLTLQETKTRAMLGALGIEPIFALPYNAQAKIIERTFGKAKEGFSKHMIGYRGGHVKERPEALADEMKRGEILDYKGLSNLFDTYIKDVLNRAPSAGKNLKGMCPDELWAKEFPGATRPSEEALMLFCMRTTADRTIARNGVKCPLGGDFYWAEWMVTRKGQRVFMRQDPKRMQKAWVFEAESGEFIGTAELALKAAAITKTDVEKQQLKELVKEKRQREKIVKEYTRVMSPEPEEKIDDMVEGVNLLNIIRGWDREAEGPAEIAILAHTEMDAVIMGERHAEEQDTADLSFFMPSGRPHEPREIFLFECDKEDAEEKKAQGGAA